MVRSLDLTPLLASFGIIAVAELGDKTQLAMIILVAKYISPLMVFTGVMFAYLTLSVIGIIIGFKIFRRFRIKMKTAASAIFITLGIIFLVSTGTGLSTL